MEKTLPRDIIVDILSRLPVKDLLRYRCVSKPWCSLIDGSDFINLHLNHSLETKSNSALILGGRRLCCIKLDTLDSAVKLNNPIDYQHKTDVIGSCNGLVALFNSHKDVALWNPSTRRYRHLPIQYRHRLSKYQSIIYGFGHDPINDDYKLVRMIRYRGEDNSFHSEAEVYSLKSKSWRRISDFPYYHRHYNRAYGVLVSNALHWVVSQKPQSDVSNLICAFDLLSEEYHEVPQPQYIDKRDFHMNVEALGGCLCVVCNYCANIPLQCNSDRVDVWVMKEYGVKESWTKLFSMTESDVNRSFRYVMPVAYVKTHDRILMYQDSKKFFVYDLERKKVENLIIPGTPDQFNVFKYFESLVGLGGRDGELRREMAEKMRKRNERLSLIPRKQIPRRCGSLKRHRLG